MRLKHPAIVRTIVAGSALVLVLAAAGVLVAPRLIERAGLREQLVEQLSKQLGAKVDLAGLRVSLLPVPHLVVDQLRLSTPMAGAAVESVSVYPGLRALLHAKLQPAQVDVAGASVQLHVERQAAVESAPEGDTTMQGARDAAAAALATVSSVAATHAPGLVVRLTHTSVDVTAADTPTVSFTDIHGTMHLPPDELRIDLAVGSNLWKQATLHAALDPGSVRGDGRLTVTGLRPQVVGSYLTSGNLEIGNATATVDVQVTAAGRDALRAAVDASVPALPLRRGAEQLTLQGAHVSVGVTVDGPRIGVTLNDVRLANSPAQLSGTLVLDGRTPQARLEVTGTDLDVLSAHEAAVFFAGTHPTAQAIFNVLQAGKVPQLTLQAQGRTLDDLGSLDAMFIRGALAGGKVRLPGNGLVLDDVSGAVSITNGVLVGERAAGRLGNTQARDGSVRIGLTDESRELSVTTAVHADVRDLPGVLKRVVANDRLTRTLERLTDVQGSAEGQFTLRGTTDAATAVVDVSQLSLSARVHGFAEPLQVEGGQFHYDPGAIAATGLKVTAGDSVMPELSVRADLSAAVPGIDVSGAGGGIALAEIYPWVAASGWLPDSAWTPTTLAGTLAVESVRVRGPAGSPKDWRIELAGAVRGLDIDAPRLRQVSALRFPVSLSRLRLAHAPTATAASMGVAAPDGLKGSVNLVWDAVRFNVKRLSVRDAHSDATLSFLLKKREFDLAFAGTLDTATLKALLPDEHDVPRSMHGDFSARISLDHPMRSTARGRLEVVHVAVPGPGNLKLDIAHAELRATGGVLAIDAQGNVSDGPLLHLYGGLRTAPHALIADLDLSAGPIEWARLAPLLPPATGGNGRSSAAAARPLRVRGKVRISAESLAYGGYVWQPVHAVVDLSDGMPSITVTQATLCRIATPGKIAMTPEGVIVQFKPAVKNQPLDQMLACLFGQRTRVTGQCNLTAQVDSAGPGADLLTSARGHVQGGLTKGRIYEGGVLEKVLAVMSVGHESWNLLADLTDDGLPYNAIEVKGDLRGGKLVLTEATMDAPSMKMVAEGTIDLNAETVDLTLLVAPLKTVDTVVSHIPILGHVLGGSLLTIPIKVKGRLQDPQVTPLDPSEVGSGLLRVMTRIVKLPVGLLNPLLPTDKKP